MTSSTTPPPEQADVLIVGGGIMGAATAFFLRRRGRSVILLERGLVGQQASGVNFGNVRRQGRHLPQLALAHRSRAIWDRLPELIGTDGEFDRTGHLRLSWTPEGDRMLEEYAEAAAPLGLDLELVRGAEVHARFPFLGPEVRMLSHSPKDGQANPRIVAPAFGRAARALGAAVHENAEVTHLERMPAGFEARTADGRRFAAPAALLVTGAWAGRFAAAMGEPIPIEANAPQMAVTEPLPYRIRQIIGIATPDHSKGLYLRQVARGNVVFGGGLRGVVRDGRAKAIPGNLPHQLDLARRFIPALAHARVIRTWAGVEAYTPDGLPVIGPSARVPDLYYAFGFCGHGFQLGPGVGDTLAELIDTGRTETPLGPYAAARFGGRAA